MSAPDMAGWEWSSLIDGNPHGWLYGSGTTMDRKWLRAWGPRGEIARRTRAALAADAAFLRAEARAKRSTP